ncbi:MAG: indolepyruvate ferredoxin oxidoreductase family protein [Rhodospirillales bacterium]|nr:indolepyruvate ferredoxin oxidoreductase family protein [Rhodospirillales bacterium]
MDQPAEARAEPEADLPNPDIEQTLLHNPYATLDDKYTLESGQIFLTGIQALVRLPILQRKRDEAAGLNTAGFISGYRGSPLGGLDQAIWSAKRFLEPHHIRFQPGVNEDLAATAVWGSQQLNLFPRARYDGVFAMWYGKGPGVDRTGDVFKHANNAGTSRFGGVLAIAGDDHACKSSTLPSQCEYSFMDAMMPVLHPANVQEILDLGIYGWELSRFSGCWIGFKTIAENVDTSASVSVDTGGPNIVIPEDFVMPEGALNIRWPDKPLEQEMRLQRYKLYAALAFARANKLDRTVLDSPNPRFGIVCTGKSYLDVMQALEDLGIDQGLASKIGLRVYKVSMVWPLERHGMRDFARGLEEILVVEEKRGVIENQLKEQLYNWDEAVRPRVVGKFDEAGEWILPSGGELTPARIARIIAARIAQFYTSERILNRLEFLRRKEEALARPRPVIERLAHYCSGCPHNKSTKVPEGSRALGGIGCHYMATWMDRSTDTFTQMGGEGVPWIGQAPFTDEPHIFANLGDGTYFHSGLLAIRAAIASRANITYKILFNDAVAMTGGQPFDGPLSVASMTHQLSGEGIRRIAVVSDDLDKHKVRKAYAEGVTFHERHSLEQVQREMREVEGTSVIIYEEVCAAEQRRRRKKGLAPDPDTLVFINEWVCEGCGDCSTTSNCLSVIPLETEFGRKREIDQSSCNKDYTCVDGFCPSFVTLEGAKVRKSALAMSDDDFPDLPQPTAPGLERPYNILITGVGGTGVVTIGALLGMAAHLEGKGCSILDQAGLAQKFGAVTSHVRISAKPEDIHAVRISAGRANLLLGCDLVVAASYDGLGKLDPELTRSVVNTYESFPSGFTRNPDFVFPAGSMQRDIDDSTVPGGAHFIDSTRLATALLGDSIGSNLFLVGFAYQKGLVPLSEEAILRAIEINGVAAEFNKKAFLWGRRAAHDGARVQELTRSRTARPALSTTLDDIVARRFEHLTGYQSRGYAKRYEALVRRVQAAESEQTPGRSGLAEAVARCYAKLLAYKDEYEVARLYTDTDFLQKIEDRFEGDYTIKFHLAPPMIAKRDPATGHLKKRPFGPWMLRAFRFLAKFRRLRGTPLDVFGYQPHRRLERRLIWEYENRIDELLAGLNQENHEFAVQIASIPDHIRGFEHIKEAHLEKARAREERLLAAFHNPPQAAAAE